MASSPNISENSRRIARNTVFLYIRMLILLFVGLYTSRVVLNALGQDDYGVYGAVGGVVSLVLVVTGAVSGAISRFLAFELGKEKSRMREVFSTTVSIQLALSVLVFLLAEVVGLWLLHTQMDIPEGRMQAAQWVLHCSILLFVVNMLSVPYNAAIIAHEKMDAFAYISIGEALLALGAALATRYTRHDKLIVYAALMLAVAVIVRAVYNLYAHRHFPECRFRLKSIDRTVIREIGSFTGWTFIGSVASVLNAHGINLLMNIFFGVRVMPPGTSLRSWRAMFPASSTTSRRLSTRKSTSPMRWEGWITCTSLYARPPSTPISCISSLRCLSSWKLRRC